MLGKHLLLELYQCDRALLDDEEFLRSECVNAARAMGASVIGVHSHRFQPVGLSVVVILAESHLALHTWPEHATASADIFVCNPVADLQRAKRHLSACLRSRHVSEQEFARGQPEQDRGRGRREIVLSAVVNQGQDSTVD
jgi:S-adenosylmethionine decarboxylase